MFYGIKGLRKYKNMPLAAYRGREYLRLTELRCSMNFVEAFVPHTGIRSNLFMQDLKLLYQVKSVVKTNPIRA